VPDRVRSLTVLDTIVDVDTFKSRSRWCRLRDAGSDRGAIGDPPQGVATIDRLAGKHFLQEDQAPAIADLVAAITPD